MNEWLTDGREWFASFDWHRLAARFLPLGVAVYGVLAGIGLIFGADANLVRSLALLTGAIVAGTGMLCRHDLSRLKRRLNGESSFLDIEAARAYPHPLLELDTDWTVQGVNPAGQRAFGLRADAINGLPLRFLIPVLTRTSDERVLRGGLPVLIEDGEATDAESVAAEAGRQLTVLATMAPGHMELGVVPCPVPEGAKDDFSRAFAATTRISMLAQMLEVFGGRLPENVEPVCLADLAERVTAAVANTLWDRSRFEGRCVASRRHHVELNSELTLFAPMLMSCRDDAVLVVELSEDEIEVLQPKLGWDSAEYEAVIERLASGGRLLGGEWDLVVCRKVLAAQRGHLDIVPRGNGVAYRMRFEAAS